MADIAKNMRISVEKDGILLFERKGDDLLVLAPYTLGRYASGVKAYSLAKGKREKGDKSEWDAAKREFREETGIDFDRLYADAYDGVRIKMRDNLLIPPVTSFHRSVQPTRKRYKSDLAMHVFEVEGLEKLQSHSKQHTDIENKEVPDFNSLLGMLRTGHINGANKFAPVLGEFEKKINNQLLREWEEKGEKEAFKPFEVIDEKSMSWLCEYYYDHPDFHALSGQVELIRDQLKKNHILSEEGADHIDGKLRLLVHYNRGADVISYDKYLADIRELADNNALYRFSMCNRAYFDQETSAMEIGESKVDTLLRIYGKLKAGDIKVDATSVTFLDGNGEGEIPGRVVSGVEMLSWAERAAARASMPANPGLASSRWTR